jgi:SOS-response transcriptional repressor LexA
MEPQEDRQKPKNRIQEWRRARGITLAELARRAGTSAQQMGRLEAGTRRLTTGWMDRIAQGLQIRPADLLPDYGGGAAGADAPGIAASRTDTLGRDVPVLGSSRSDLGTTLLRGAPVAYAQRPEPLAGVIDAFAFRAVDDSMAPAYRLGDVVFVHSGIEPQPGHDVVLLGNPREDGVTLARLARLASVDGASLVLDSLNPRSSQTVDRGAWSRCGVVVVCFRRL